MTVTDVGSWDFGSAGVKEVRTSLDVSLGISGAKRDLGKLSQWSFEGVTQVTL